MANSEAASRGNFLKPADFSRLGGHTRPHRPLFQPNLSQEITKAKQCIALPGFFSKLLEQLRSMLGITSVKLVQGESALAIIDSTLAP